MASGAYGVGARPAGERAGRAGAWLRRGLGTNPLPLACAGVVLGGILALLAFVVYMTFVPGLPTEPGFTLAHWALLASPRFLTVVLPNTAVVGFGAIAVASCFALPLAWLLNRTTLPLRNTFTTLMALVAVMPGYAVTMGWIMLLDERIGLLNQLAAALLGQPSVPVSVMNNLVGIAWVLGLILTPAIFFQVAGPMRAIDPALEEAARTSGASHGRVLWRVDLPLVWPAILGALIYTFITAVSIFEVPALLGAASGKVPVLASEIFYAVRPGGPTTATFAYGAAGVYGLFLAVPSLVALYFYLRLLAQARRYQVITGKGYRPHDVELGRLTWLGVAFVGVYLLLAVGLPLLVLVYASLLPLLQMPSAEALGKLTLANYQGLLPRLGGPPVLRNTLLLVVSVSLLVTFFSFMISWVVVRSQVRGRQALDVLAVLPHAIPSLAFAFALAMLGILALKWVAWLPLAGTLGIIVIAHLINRLPYGTRITNGALVQVHRELEESAEMSGARELTIMRRILLPLIKPALVYLALWTALLSLQEVTMALFLSGPQNRVLSVSIWELWQAGHLGPAAAGTVVVAAILGVLMFFVLRLTGDVVAVRSQPLARAADAADGA
jgi:iron(III) transport system permease protein